MNPMNVISCVDIASKGELLTLKTMSYGCEIERKTIE